jgi:hypothetical protein
MQLMGHNNVLEGNSVLLKNVIRSVAGSGPSTPQPPSSDSKKGPTAEKEEQSSKLNPNKFLENYKPLLEQKDKALQVVKVTSKQFTEKLTQYYNEKRNYFAKGNILSAEGEEEHWYSARVNFMMKRYEDFVGLTDVKNAQVRVQKTEKLFVTSQDDRREAQKLINDVQAEIKHLHTELERTHRGEDKYLELVTQEHQVLRKERSLIDELALLERNEREAFSRLSRAVRDSHESERAQAEKTKYWAVIGSIIGTTLGVLGTTINNRLRMRELRKIVRDAASVNTQAGAGAVAVAMATENEATESAQINDNLVAIKDAVVTELNDKFGEFSKQIENVENVTTKTVSEVSNSILKLSEAFGDQQSKSIEALSLLERRSAIQHKVVFE